MSNYEKNKEVLVQHGIDISPLSETKGTVRIIPGHRGYYTALWRYGVREILLHSAYDPRLEAQRMLEDEDYTQYSSLFVLGIGLGYHVLELLKSVGSQAVVYIIESDWDMLSAAMEVLDFSEFLGPRVVLACGTPAQIRSRLDSFWTGADWVVRLHHSGFFVFPPLQRLNTDLIREERQTILDLIRYHRWGMGLDIRDNLLSVTDIAAHAIYLARSPHPSKLKDAWKRPVVIVLAGPSVNKNIHVLKEWQDKVTIFCVNTVFNKLLDNGIIPDATFSLDRGLMIFDTDYHRETPIPDSILFVGSPVVDPRIVTKFRHSIFVLNSEEAYQRELASVLGERETLLAGLSVTHFTFTFTRYCGASPIILIGQDLAFGEGGHTHASGTMYEQDVVNYEASQGIVYIEGYYGGTVPTTNTWRMFRDWYEIELTRNPTFLINATEGGARIAGTVQMTLREALEQYVGTNAVAKDSFLNWIISLENDEEVIYNLRSIYDSFKKRQDILFEIEDKSLRSIKMCKKILAPKLPKRLKNRYLEEVMQTSFEIFNDNWIYTAYRPEFVRIMEKCKIGLEGGSLAASCDEKATYLLEMFINLLSFLPKLKEALGNALEKIDHELEIENAEKLKTGVE